MRSRPWSTGRSRPWRSSSTCRRGWRIPKTPRKGCGPSSSAGPRSSRGSSKRAWAGPPAAWRLGWVDRTPEASLRKRVAHNLIWRYNFAMPAKHASADELLHLDTQLCFSLYSASLAMTKLYKPLLEELGLTYPQYLAML